MENLQLDFDSDYMPIWNAHEICICTFSIYTFFVLTYEPIGFSMCEFQSI